MGHIYHLTTRPAWAQAQAAGSYRESTRGLSLADVGFIHCSYAEQLPRVARSFYADVPDLLLLTIDPARLTAELREERVGDAGEVYPHIYGPLNLDAVLASEGYALTQMPTIPDSHRPLLDGPVGVLATIGPDGLPQVTALWFLFDPAEGAVRFSLNTARQKVKNLSARPVASFLVVDPATPYRTLELRGRVEVQPDDDYAFADRLGSKYGADIRKMDQPGQHRVAITLRPTRVNTWGQ